MNGDYRVITVLIHLPVSDHMSLQGTCIVVVLISDRCVMETARHFTFLTIQLMQCDLLTPSLCMNLLIKRILISS